jgi:rRNA maturation endonuclease Nob1
MNKALPAFMYGNPESAAIRNEEKKCTGCKSLMNTLGREFCGIGKRKLERCRKYSEKEKVKL